MDGIETDQTTEENSTLDLAQISTSVGLGIFLPIAFHEVTTRALSLAPLRTSLIATTGLVLYLGIRTGVNKFKNSDLSIRDSFQLIFANKQDRLLYQTTFAVLTLIFIGNIIGHIRFNGFNFDFHKIIKSDLPEIQPTPIPTPLPPKYFPAGSSQT